MLVMGSEVVTLLVGFNNGQPDRSREFNLIYDTDCERWTEEGREGEREEKMEIWKVEGMVGGTKR